MTIKELSQRQAESDVNEVTVLRNMLATEHAKNVALAEEITRKQEEIAQKQAQIIENAAKRQGDRIADLFRFHEELHRKERDDDRRRDEEDRHLERENRKSLRRYGTIMAAAMVGMAGAMYAVLILPGNDFIAEALMVCMGCLGTGLGVALSDIARRITV